jgi:hypothetical protein
MLNYSNTETYRAFKLFATFETQRFMSKYFNTETYRAFKNFGNCNTKFQVKIV